MGAAALRFVSQLLGEVLRIHRGFAFRSCSLWRKVARSGSRVLRTTKSIAGFARDPEFGRALRRRLHEPGLRFASVHQDGRRRGQVAHTSGLSVRRDSSLVHGCRGELRPGVERGSFWEFARAFPECADGGFGRARRQFVRAVLSVGAGFVCADFRAT